VENVENVENVASEARPLYVRRLRVSVPRTSRKLGRALLRCARSVRRPRTTIHGIANMLRNARVASAPKTSWCAPAPTTRTTLTIQRAESATRTSTSRHRDGRGGEAPACGSRGGRGGGADGERANGSPTAGTAGGATGVGIKAAGPFAAKPRPLQIRILQRFPSVQSRLHVDAGGCRRNLNVFLMRLELGSGLRRMAGHAGPTGDPPCLAPLPRGERRHASRAGKGTFPP
jgi:hypothetical protein